MATKKLVKHIAPSMVPEKTSKKILSFINTARSAEEIADAIEIPNENDIGIKTAESILARRTQLGGFHSLSQVATTPLVGDVRFDQLVKSLEERPVKTEKHCIKGQLKSDQKVSFSDTELTVYAIVNGVEIASSKVDAKGKYKMEFELKNTPGCVELHVLPSEIPMRTSRSYTLCKRIYSTSFSTIGEVHQAEATIRIPGVLDKQKLDWFSSYRLHGTVYAAEFDDQLINWGDPLPAAKIDFYEVDNPRFSDPETVEESRLHEEHIGYTYTDLDGCYNFTIENNLLTYPGRPVLVIPNAADFDWTYVDNSIPDIRVRISQFMDGTWYEVYKGRVEWDISEDFRRDFYIPIEDVLPPDPGGVRPDQGFLFISLGSLPIDNDHIKLGYAYSNPDDQLQVSHQPFCDTLHIFGLFAEAPPVFTYKVQVATADEDRVTGEWEDITDALHNCKWNPDLRRWDNKILGPDPETNCYQNIEIQDAIWGKPTLKIRWNSRNVNDGYYALRIIGYDGNGVEVNPENYPGDSPDDIPFIILRVDNSVPEANLEVLGTIQGELEECGLLELGIDREIQFNIKAYDPAGHLYSYSLNGQRGMTPDCAGTPVAESRPDSEAGWTGYQALQVDFSVRTLPPSLRRCPAIAYHFELHVQGLSTNGETAHPWSQHVIKSTNLVVADQPLVE